MAVWRFNTDPKILQGPLMDQVLLSRPQSEYAPESGEVGNLQAAAEAIYAHTGKVAVFGDYDCDGLCGTLILDETLRRMGRETVVRFPTRDEGYGIRAAHVRQMVEQGVSLIITVDNGIAAVEAAAAARELGVAMIVTDHHERRETLPDCLVVNPKVTGGFRDYCGAGVAYLLAGALCRRAGLPGPDELLDLLCIATVADMVPLAGPNFDLARAGLLRMRDAPRPGIKALLDVAGVKSGSVNGFHLGWTIGPRLNAAGRIGHPTEAYRLLKAETYAEALPIAEKLDQLNRERQALVKRATEKCLEAYDKSDFPVLVGPWARGIVGIVASRVVEEIRRPAIVGRLHIGTVYASGRSIGSFDILAALDECRNLFTRYGGHKAACGLEFDAKELPRVSAALGAVAKRALRPEDTARIIDVHGKITAAPRPDEVLALDSLEPFGVGNPEPVFVLAGPIQDVRRGDNWQLLRICGVKMFVSPEFSAKLGRMTHAAVKLGLDEYRGSVSVMGRAEDIRHFSCTRATLSSAFKAWCRGQSVDPRLERIFRELGVHNGGHCRPNLLASPTFQQYGIVVG